MGAIGYSLLALSYLKKKKKDIIIVQTFAYIGFTTHYFLLNAKTGTICNIIGFIVLELMYFFSNNEKTKLLIILILIPILLLFSCLFYENIYSIFPVFACIISFFSFLSKDENKIRFTGIIATFCWFIYAIIHVSYSAIIFEILTLILTTYSYLKYKKN